MQKALEGAFVILLAYMDNMLRCLFHHVMLTESWMLDSEISVISLCILKLIVEWIIHQPTEKQIYLQNHTMINICLLL